MNGARRLQRTIDFLTTDQRKKNREMQRKPLTSGPAQVLKALVGAAFGEGLRGFEAWS